MKTGSVIVTVIVTVVALVGVVWIGRGQETVDVKPVAEIPVGDEDGPQPKAVIDETIHDFGVMEFGKKGSHVYTIRNEGEGVLNLLARKGDTTCQCTFGELGKDGRAAVQPGKSTTVNLKWEIKSPKTKFMHTAIVRTNDLENKDIHLTVKGRIGRRFIVLPSLEWKCGKLTSEKPTKVVGTFLSEIVDDFKILKLESDSPYLTTGEVTKLTEAQLVEMQDDPEAERSREMVAIETGRNSPPRPGENDDLKQPPLKSGYRVQVILSTEIPIGRFRGQLTVITDADPENEYFIYVSGMRSGPIDVFATSKSQWMSRSMSLRMGDFPAKDGRTSKATFFFKNCKEEIKILDAKYDSKNLKITYEKDPEFKDGGRQRFRMTFEVPAGNLPMVRDTANPLPITFKTNHPDAAEFTIRVLFISR